jgi:hypothetical protein
VSAEGPGVVVRTRGANVTITGLGGAMIFAEDGAKFTNSYKYGPYGLMSPVTVEYPDPKNPNQIKAQVVGVNEQAQLPAKVWIRIK